MIKLSGVSKYYKTATGVSEGMRNISLDFKLNEFVAITGQSGSGKTTLLNVISGLDSYEDGELFVNNLETSHYTVKEWEDFRAKNIGFVFQNYNVIDSYTVYQNVVIALEAQGYNENNKKERALELIDRVGLTSHKDQKTSKLSGGQKQRVVIARALAKNAPIILADEPTGNLDEKSGREIMQLLKEISEDKLIILVTHNFDEAKDYVTRNIVMSDGNIKEDKIIGESKIKSEEVIIESNNNNDSSYKTASVIALRNLKATPKRTFFSIMLVIFSVMIFTIFYAALIKNNNSVASDSSQQASIVARNNEYLTNDEIKYIKSTETKHIRLDIDYSDYQVIYNLNNTNVKAFFQTTETLSKKDVDGELPKNNNEIVIANHWNFEIGETIKLSQIIESKKMSTTTLYFDDYKVVGKTNDNYYMSHSFRKDIMFFINKDLIFDNEYNFFNDAFKYDEAISRIDIYGSDRQEVKLYKKKIANQEGLRFIDDYLIFEYEMQFVDSTLKLFLWAVLLFILSIVFLVLFHIFKNVMESRKKDFAVYRSIGISEKEVGITIVVEQLIIALIAVLVTIIILNILGFTVPFFRNLTRHLSIWDYLLVGFIFAVFSIMLGLRYNKKVFNITVIESLKEDN